MPWCLMFYVTITLCLMYITITLCLMLYITITLCLMFLFSGVLTLDLSSGLVREAHDSALISHVISPLNTYQDDESRQKLGSLR